MEEKEKLRESLDELRKAVKTIAKKLKDNTKIEISDKVSEEEYRKALKDIMKSVYETAYMMLNNDVPFFDKEIVFEYARIVGQTEILIYLLSK